MVETLGLFSSHPRFAPFRLLFWYGFAVAPLVVGIAIIGYWLSCDPRAALSCLVNYGSFFLIYGLAAFVFAVGLGVTAATTTCLARGSRFIHDDKAPWSLVIAIVACLFSVGLLTWLVPYAVGFQPRTRAFIGWLGLLPLFLLVLLATFISSDDGPAGRRRRIRSLVVAIVATLALVATRVQAVATWITESDFGVALARLIQDASPASASALDPSFHAWVVTGLMTILTLPILALVLTVIEALCTPWSPAAEPSSEPSVTTPSWPSQIGSLVDPEGRCGSWEPRQYQAHAGSVRAGAADPSNDFFGGFTPTVDQAAAFRRITTRYPARQQPGASPPFVTTNDFIVAGPRGSGRTSTATAAILHAIAIEGNSTLLLVPTAGKRRILASRLRESSRLLGLREFIDVLELIPDDMAAWASSKVSSPGDGGAASPATGDAPRIPDVLVGTLADFELQFFSQAYETESVAPFLRQLRLIVVEDVDLFSVQDRLHLPYILAKVRLILGSTGLGCQTVVIVPPMAPAANALTAQQLLAAGSESDPVTRLRPPIPTSAEPTIWGVPLTADPGNSWTVESLLEACGRACAEAGIDTVVYSPILSAADRNSLAHRCNVSSGQGRRATVSVISDVDEWYDLNLQGQGQIATILHSTQDGATVALAVIGLNPNRDAVVFAVSPPGLPQGSSDAVHSLMVLPGRASRSLFAQHFASAARFLKRLTPAPRSLWTALGFPRPGQLAADPPHWKRGQRLSDRMIWLDPPDPVSVAASADPACWPWATMAPATATDAVPSARPVRISGNLDRTLVLHADPGGDECQIVLRNDADHDDATEYRDFLWLADDGTEHGRGDLAYLSDFRLRTESGFMIPSRIEGSDRGPLQIFARPWSASSRDGQAYMPALELIDLALPSSFDAKHLLLNSMLADRVAVYGLVPRTEDGEQPSPLLRRQYAEFRLRGIYDSGCKVRPCDARIRYEASKFIVLLDPSSHFLEPEMIHRHMFVQWGRGRPQTHEIVPELGAAITFAMRRQAPGLERLVRCLGVRICLAGMEPQLGLVFVEPRSTESSGFALMEPIVCDGDVMAEFFDSAASLLEQCQSHPAAVFARAGAGIDCEIKDGLLLGNPSSIEACARVLRSIANDVAACR